jgi:hypothetical protein
MGQLAGSIKIRPSHSMPFNASGTSNPLCSGNNDIALGCLFLRPGDGAWAEIGDKLSQCLRTSGVGYNHFVTGDDQMAPVYPSRQGMVRRRRNSSGPPRWPFATWVTEPCCVNRFYNHLQARGDCQTQRKSCKTLNCGLGCGLKNEEPWNHPPGFVDALGRRASRGA